MKRFAILSLILSVGGCVPAIDAEIGLIEQSRRGVAMVKQSLSTRRELILSAGASDRRRLDEAFDADVAGRRDLSPQWIIDARKAYAIGLDGLARRDRASAAAIDADLDNLAAVDESLVQLDRLNRAQLGFASQLEKRK